MKAFLKGMGSILNLFPIKNDSAIYIKIKTIKIPTHTDQEAIKNDWEIVGRDMLKAFEACKNTIQVNQNKKRHV
ncbi:MAG: hypothetical protein ACYC0J_09515 [Gammaproteobacteria bacterium]